MRKLILLAVLMFTHSLWAAISYAGSGTTVACTNASTSVKTCTSASLTIASGQTFFIAVSSGTSNTTVSSIALAGNTLTKIGPASGARVELWSTTINGSVAVSSGTFVVTMSANGRFAATSGSWAASTALGNTGAYTAIGTANPTSPSITTQDANNWCVAAFGGFNNTAFTTGSAGTVRGAAASGSAGGAGVAIADNTTVSSGGSCSVNVTSLASTAAASTVELRNTVSSSSFMSPFVAEDLSAKHK